MPQILDRVAAEPGLRDEIVQKVPRGGPGDIKLGSPLIVQPGETAVFVRQGEPLGTFTSGTHVLSTNSIPVLGDMIERGIFGGKNVFTADVFFVKTTDMTLKWGTAQPIIVEHFNRPPGASAMVGNGTYVAKVKEPWRFLTAMDAFRDTVRQPQIKNRLDPMLGVMMQDKLSELAIERNLGPAHLQSFSKDLNELLIGLLQAEFDSIGMVLVDFNIRLGLHPRSLQVVTDMGYGTSYVERQMADATLAAGENPSGSNLGEIGFGMMGMTAMQHMQQQQQQQQQGQQGQQGASSDSGSESSQLPDVMTPEQVASFLQVSPEDIVDAIEAGDLKARKIGKAYRISKANLEEFLNG
ncbi:MAG TPA: SPFH domain-containing protein [Candidatus Sulfomarinibacteraceae bacterium]|nr:SPFH domain-containing protein [Candidatus Sulfomarinibacteraceae bacterium]